MLGIAATLLGGLFSTASNNANNRRNQASSERLNMLNISEARRAERVGIEQVLLAEGRADKRTAENRAYDDPTEQRARLEAAGFNPAAYLNTNPSTQGAAIAANSAPLPRLSMSTAQSLSAGGLSSAFSQVGQLLSERSNLIMKNDMLNNRLESQTIQPNVGGVYEGKRNAYSPRNHRVSKRSSRGPVPAGDDLLVSGKTIYANEGYSDAEEHERRYGDVGSAITGLGVMAADVGFNSYLLKRRDEGVIDLSFLKDEYSRKGVRPRARNPVRDFSKPQKIITTELTADRPYRRSHSINSRVNMSWYK